jgi:hypothetical protein
MKPNIPTPADAPPWARLLVSQIVAAFERWESSRHRVVASVADLPDPAFWNTRKIIVRDIGAGAPGEATALDGKWYDQTWSEL